MSSDQSRCLDKRTQRAVRELEETILRHYPTASFELSRAVDDPASIHLITTVDVDDPDEVGDLVIDRVVELQVEEGIPLHVIPVRPLARVLAELEMRPERPYPRLPRLGDSSLTPPG
ncbi:MAG: hypothetical protein HYY04_12005 [Chloroflexi bacterium]|nr:hypothetical protein [Chloroflexota bacterium]